MADKEYDLDQPMESLIDLAVKKFGEVEFQTVSVADVLIEVLQIKDMQRYIDKLVDKTRAGKTVDLPLWAKIWPSSLILGYTLHRFPFHEGAQILEIGAGGAVNGLVLAKRGFDVTVTDISWDALLFSRINALRNRLGDSIKIERTDFTRDKLGRSFDCIVGCEVLYDEVVFEPLVAFLEGHLACKSSAEVILAIDEKRQARKFFAGASDHFNMMKTCAKYTEQGSGNERVVNLFRLRRK